MPNPDGENNVSYIYIISNGTYTKVGKADNAEKRRKTLQTASPTPLILDHKFPVKTTAVVSIESRCHKHLAGLGFSQMKGEWFDIAPREAVSVLSAFLEDDVVTDVPAELECRERSRLAKERDDLIKAQEEAEMASDSAIMLSRELFRYERAISLMSLSKLKLSWMEQQEKAHKLHEKAYGTSTKEECPVHIKLPRGYDDLGITFENKGMGSFDVFNHLGTIGRIEIKPRTDGDTKFRHGYKFCWRIGYGQGREEGEDYSLVAAVARISDRVSWSGEVHSVREAEMKELFTSSPLMALFNRPPSAK